MVECLPSKQRTGVRFSPPAPQQSFVNLSKLKNMNFKGYDSKIHFITRALLVQGDKVLLCKPIKKDWYFLPGGHIEEGETAKEALLRELIEELGEGGYKVGEFIGACENLFPLKENLSHHEINLAFLVEVSSGIKLKSIEEHIEFVLVDKDSLADYALLPKSFKEGIIGWLENKQTFFRSFD